MKGILSKPLAAVLVVMAGVSLWAGECIWTGGADPADGKWSNPDNWKEGLGPKAGSADSVKINGEAGLVDGVMENDIEGLNLSSLYIQGKKSLKLTGNAIAFRNVGSCAFNECAAAVTNAVDFIFVKDSNKIDNKGGGTLVLEGTFVGEATSLMLNNAGSSSYTIIAGTGTAQVLELTSYGHMGIANPAFLGADQTFSYNGQLEFLAGGDFLCDFNYVGTATVDVFWRVPGVTYNYYGTFGSGTAENEFRLRSGDNNMGSSEIHFYNVFSVPTAKIYPICKSQYFFHGKVCVPAFRTGDWQADCNPFFHFLSTENEIAKLSPGFTLRPSLDADNVLPGTVISYEYYTSGTAPGAACGVIELNGTDQTFDRIDSDATRLAGKAGAIRSKYYAPDWGGGTSKLTLKGTDSAATSTKVYDNISIVWSPVDKTYQQTFQGQESPTTGSLIVTNGILEIGMGASFPNVKTVTVQKDGELIVNTSVASALKSVTKLTVEDGGKVTIVAGATPFGTTGIAEVQLAETAVMEIADGINCKVKTVVAGNRILPRGAFTGDTTQDNYVPQLLGTGILQPISTIEDYVSTWTGAAGDGKWSNPGNWDRRVMDGGAVVLNEQGTVDGEMENDFEALTLRGVNFAGSAPYRLKGNMIFINTWNETVLKSATLASNDQAITNACDICCINEYSQFKMSNVYAGRMVLEGAFSGDVQLLLRGGAWTVSGANQHLQGMALGGNPSVQLANPSAIGDPASKLTYGTGVVSFAVPGDYYNDIEITYEEGKSVTWDISNIGDYNFYGKVSAPNIANFAMAMLSSDFRLQPGTVTFHNEFSMPKALVYPRFWHSWTVKFLDKVTVAGTTGSNWTSDAAVPCEFYATNDIGTFHLSRMQKFFAKAANAFPGALLSWDVSGLVSNVKNPLTGETGYFDLGGLDQTFDRLDNGGFFQGEGKEHGLVTTSGECQLMLNGTGNALTTAYLNGPINLVWAPTDKSYVQAFTNRTHAISGSATVTNGILRFEGATTLAKLKRITVQKDGDFQLSTTSANSLAALESLKIAADGKFTAAKAPTALTAGLANVELESGAELTIPDGETWTVNWVTVDGDSLEPDTYTSATLPELKSGTLIVNRRKPGGMVLLVK